MKQKWCFLSYLMLLGLMFLGQCLGLLACVPGKYDSLHKGVTLQLSREPMSLDPSWAEDGVSLQVLNNIWDGLYGYDAQGNLETRLAESTHLSPDHKILEVALKRGRLWSDGQPVRVQDFVTAFKRVLGPKSVSILTPLFMGIRGAENFHFGKGSWDQVGIFEKNQTILRIELTRPIAHFLHLLALPPAFPLRQEILEKNQGKWPEKAPTTGAFRLVAHEIDRRIHIQPNEFHPDMKNSSKGMDIEFQVITDELTGLHLFESGQLDLLTRIPPMDVQRLKQKGKVITTPFLATYYLTFNCRKPPFQDRRWRQRVAEAIQKEELVTLVGGGESVAWSWIPPHLEGHQALPSTQKKITPSNDTEWFKKRMKDIGSVALWSDAGTRNMLILEKIQYDLKKKMGIELPLMTLEWRDYLKKLRTDTPPLFKFAWMSPIMDPTPHLFLWMTGSINNLSGCSNARYDALVKKIEGEASGLDRTRWIQEAQHILVDEEAFVVPLYHYVQNTGVSERVHGFEMDPMGVVHLKKLFVSP